jgi:DtxR family Mn-dependent transcriptional regulator
MLTFTEENYLKAIYHLEVSSETKETSTNTIAEHLTIKPATVTAMLKKLNEKKYISYQKYGKVSLSESGKNIALQVIRKHRLWEVFLVDKLDFTWDEVHEIAEQLEHIQSSKLIDKLDRFLKYPAFDPHGDPIPDTAGVIHEQTRLTLAQAETGKIYKVLAVNDTSSAFLQYLMQLQITLSTKLKVLSRLEFDQSMIILINNKREIIISEKFSQNIIIA